MDISEKINIQSQRVFCVIALKCVAHIFGDVITHPINQLRYIHVAQDSKFAILCSVVFNNEKNK